MFAWTMRITHHLHGVENVQAIANLPLMRGMVGRAGMLRLAARCGQQGRAGKPGARPPARGSPAGAGAGVGWPPHHGSAGLRLLQHWAQAAPITSM